MRVGGGGGGGGGGVVFSLNKMSLLHAYEHEIFAAGTDAFFRAIGFLNRF